MSGLTFGGAPRPWGASSNNTNACATVHDAEGICIGTADSRHAGMDAPAIAVLFAAAPELADALEAILTSDGFQGTFDASALHAAHGRALEALRKAGRLP